MNIPRFTADVSVPVAGPVPVTGTGAGTPLPDPSWWCKLFPWLCAVCSPCSALHIQHCCEPGGQICNPSTGVCRQTWNCFDRRC